MNRMLVALFLSFFSGHALACPVVFSEAYTFEQPTRAVRGRVYVFGSLNILSEHNFTDRLLEKGFQVVSLAIPQIQPCLYVGDGKQYEIAVSSALRSVLGTVNAKFGPAKSIIGGGSIGGLHALMGYATVPGFSGWFTSMPVIRLSALQEFAGLPQPSAFDPLSLTDHFIGSTGLITWGTADTRVDYRLSQDFYARIGSGQVTSIEYAGLEHATTPKQIDDLVDWIDRTF